jgi:hypothetical protein
MVRWSDGLYGGLIAGCVSAWSALRAVSALLIRRVFRDFICEHRVALQASWTAPTSVLCGIAYGFFMYFMNEDVAVPLMRVVSTTPLWEALVGNIHLAGLA